MYLLVKEAGVSRLWCAEYVAPESVWRAALTCQYLHFCTCSKASIFVIVKRVYLDVAMRLWLSKRLCYCRRQIRTYLNTHMWYYEEV
jgi:hypothetical protein